MANTQLERCWRENGLAYETRSRAAGSSGSLSRETRGARTRASSPTATLGTELPNAGRGYFNTADFPYFISAQADISDFVPGQVRLLLAQPSTNKAEQWARDRMHSPAVMLAASAFAMSWSLTPDSELLTAVVTRAITASKLRSEFA